MFRKLSWLVWSKHTRAPWVPRKIVETCGRKRWGTCSQIYEVYSGRGGLDWELDLKLDCPSVRRLHELHLLKRVMKWQCESSLYQRQAVSAQDDGARCEEWEGRTQSW